MGEFVREYHNDEESSESANNTLVACIEILSPVNKRAPGLTPYRQKRQRLSSANVHLYDEAAYDLSIDYRQVPPPPLLSQADLQWVDILLK